MREIADGIFVEATLRGMTIGAVQTDEGFVLIDAPPFPNDARRWQEMLRDFADIPIRAVIMLDSHRDRMLGASWFKPELLIAHVSTRKFVSNLSGSYVSTIANMLSSNPTEQTALLSGKILKPTISFTKTMRLHFGKTAIILEHQPGPMHGSIWVRCQDVLFTGDSVVVETPPYLNGPYSKEWLEGLRYLQDDLKAVTIVPGRGGDVVDRSQIEPIQQYLQLARDRMRDLFEMRRPLSETSKIVHELLTLFPPPLEYELAEVQQRVRTGLQFIYNEFREHEFGRIELEDTPIPGGND